ncbi:MAG: N-acetylneuraminate synthase [Lachnospiraceae bacterium]|nr:N-acetylneuraminate synthase [Lachnospiraceae bacterium]
MAVKIIAEAGVNHNGSLTMAKQLVDAAKEAGADYVKFQTFNPKKLVAKSAKTAEYQKKNIGSDESQLTMLEKLALDQDAFVELKQYCEQVGIGFLSTPFDLESLAFLDKLGMDFWKLPSGEITNLPYLEAIAKTNRPVVMSTGMADMKEIKAALKVLRSQGPKDITVLQCNTEYPTPYEDVNLLAMETIQESLSVKVGYSDHTRGIAIPLAAAGLGAKVIEKHFTLDRTLPGPDHVASLEPEELKEMVQGIRQIEKALGSGIKEPSPSEMKNKVAARKSLVAAKKIHKGEEFTPENITVKRPGNGISPMHYYDIIGTVADRDYEEDQTIEGKA